MKLYLLFNAIILTIVVVESTNAQSVKRPFLPSQLEISRPFDKSDEAFFLAPPKIYHPETWFHFIGGNVGKDGITKDLEAIAKAGFSGIQLFHGHFGGPWPGIPDQITSLSTNWDDAVKFTATECRRLNLNFSMNNCPGWATSGGPWITPSNAMRNLVWSRTDVTGGRSGIRRLPAPQPSTEAWRDYKDITVLAFPTPSGDSGNPLLPQSIESNVSIDWRPYFSGQAKTPVRLSPSERHTPYWVEVTFDKPVLLRSVEFPSIQTFNHNQAYEPGVKISISAVLESGKVQNLLDVDVPQSNWLDDQPMTLACSEIANVKKYRISISNRYKTELSSLRLFSAARKNGWESEAAWTLRSIERNGQDPVQSPKAFIDPMQILDISNKMGKDGNLNWLAPKGKWTILRIGHVNTGKQNVPAPKEATGWEADKLSDSGAESHFAGYIGRLSGPKGPLTDGLLNGMLIDSWECGTQTWTPDMEKEFRQLSRYELRKWLPAVFGYVVKDHATTGRFLIDWRKTINYLFTNKYYGRMASLAKKNGLNVSYETSAGDVLPGDILEYFKFADIPMAEFWQPVSKDFVGSINFKPVKPTASAARMYGKPRVAAEAFTSVALTWDEHFETLKEVANINSAEGVTHYVFHTYTHNPQTPFLPPGSSFGAGIGTPFLRGQTWWQYMPDFTNYLARCTYMLERGRPVSDVLWYLGDELNHKPDQKATFPKGFKYDYCNSDVLMNRLSVKDGKLVTPEGIQYRVLWLPDAPRMLPQTLEKIRNLVKNGATVIGEAPIGLATLSGGRSAKVHFDAAVKDIWGVSQKGRRTNGKGCVISGLTLDQALTALKINPDVKGGDILWVHRRAAGADWYFLSAPEGKGFKGELSFRASGAAELWDPATGTYLPIESNSDAGRTRIKLELLKSNSCFIVFRHDSTRPVASENVKNRAITPLEIKGPWTLKFPEGWGASELTPAGLKPWKDLDLSAEGKAFSGTATYTTTFNIDSVQLNTGYVLDLGRVDMIASVFLNGTLVGNLLAPPYRIALKDLLKQGENQLSVEVTSTWFNRLVYDAGQAQGKRKTWTISGPDNNLPLRESGLMGPVVIRSAAPK